MHSLAQIDQEARTAICSSCGPVKIKYKGLSQWGKPQWRCRQAERLTRRPHRAACEDRCERCGFEAEHPCQLDIHHRDGDHSNNDETNLQTLCANCHRLVEHEKRLQAL